MIAVFNLIVDIDKLRKIEKEIGATINRTQINYLMSSRRKLLKEIGALRGEISIRVTDLNATGFRVFQLVCRVLNSFYGRRVGESLLLTFERQSGLSSLEVINYPDIFEKVVRNTLGLRAAETVSEVLAAEIGREFGFRFTKSMSLGEAIHMARQSGEIEKDSLTSVRK